MATGRVPTTANSPLTAKGDLFGYSTTQARVPVGNDGETIVADSSTSTGLRYQGNFAAGKNKIINGDFGIWQRGTSVTVGSGSWTYNCDRYSAYQTYSAGSLVFSRQTFTPGTAPVAGYEGNFFLRATAPTTGTSELNFRQLIENVTTFAGQTVTFSFWAKASGATTSSIKLTQDFGSGGSARVDSALTTVNLTTSWARYSMTVTLASIAGKTIGTGSALDAYFFTNSSFTGGATIDFWGWQVEAGSVATAFQTATGTIQGELAACQRYYWRTTPGIVGGMVSPYGYNYNNTLSVGNFSFPVTMRIAPTSLETSALSFSRYDDTSYAMSSLTLQGTLTTASAASFYGTISGGTAGQAGKIITTSTTGYLGFSAEL